jgi:predicted O-methyltransferase YrrM
LPWFLSRINPERYFQAWQDQGFTILRNSFYAPVPVFNELSEEIWDKQTELLGIDMNERVQLEFLHQVFPVFQDEYRDFPQHETPDPYQFHYDNGTFVGADAIVLHCMARHFRPKIVIEVGSGFSTRLTAQAIRSNGGAHLICIEPYPSPSILTQPGVSELVQKRVEEVDLRLFESLDANDLLFIDSTHTAKVGGDVAYLFLEVLPRLKPGVIVHVHDIFLPRNYPRGWIRDALMFSNEQYLLQAFLLYNSSYEVLFSNSYMTICYHESMEQQFSEYPRWDEGCSFWMRRISG